MLKKYKQFLLGFIIASLLFSSITVFADLTEIKAYLSDIKIALNGRILELKDANGNKVTPVVYNGTTYLPVRALANAFGKDVNYDSVANTVNITDKVVVKPEPEPIVTKKEPEKENQISTVSISNKEYITIGQFIEVYYDKGYRLQNIGNGYFRFFYMQNGIQTNLISKVRVLIKDNEYYLDCNYFKEKMLPLIKE